MGMMLRPPLLLVLLLLLGWGGRPLLAGEATTERIRKESIKKLGKTLQKRAKSRRAPKYEKEMLEILAALDALGGVEAGLAALKGLPYDGEKVRDAIFALVDKEHAPQTVGPLGRLLEDKRYRRDVDVRKRVARSLSVVGDPDAIPPLSTLIRTDEDADVVAAAADALATYAAAPIRLRKVAVEQLVGVYATTWNLMRSVDPKQKVIAGVMKKRWKVYASPVRHALRMLTGQADISRPQDWRTWWNKNKKRRDW